MKSRYVVLIATLVALPAAAAAQTPETRVAENKIVPAVETPAPAADAEKPKEQKPATSRYMASAPKIELQHYRPTDKRGVNMFETPKEEGQPYTGFKLNWGAAFTQQFQGLDHSNTAAPRIVNGTDRNRLVPIGHGFNNANANLYLNAQLAKGIRVSLATYLSTRHHNETWVKDGFFLIDDSPIEMPLLQNIMKYVTLRIGHFEINYGDAHFRRSDAGNAMYNPLVGNYVMDAFTTEIGAEAYLRKGPFMAMAGMTNGEIRGQVRQPKDRAPTYLAKLGFDKQFNPDFRFRLTGSMYQTDKSANNTLYSGDRAGSRYYSVVDSLASTEAAQAWSGSIQPGFRSAVKAFQLNPFIKVKGLELFGVAEKAEGRTAAEQTSREWTQYAGDIVYRFLADERVYAAARYNTAKGELAGMTSEVSVDRYQLGGGWYITPNVLMKAEWVNQKYKDFPVADIRNGAKFRGYVIEGVVAF